MKKFIAVMTAIALLLGFAYIAQAYTKTTYYDAQCSSGSNLGTSQYIEDISYGAAAGATCAPYCASVNAACCTEKEYVFDDSESEDPMSYIQYDCTAYSGSATSSKAATYTWSPPPGFGPYRTYSTSWSATLLSYAAPPTASLVANPTSITSGQSSLLTWSSTGSTSCTGTGFSTANATSGSVSVSPAVTTTYTASCTNGTQTASASASVTVSSLMAVSCTATPSPADLFGDVMWTAQVSNGQEPLTYVWSGTDGLSGSAAYVLTSYNTVGNKSAHVTVTSPSTGGTGGSTSTYTDIPLGYGQCSGGVLVGQDMEVQDIDLVPLSVQYLEDKCSVLVSNGQCCDVTVNYPPDAQMTNLTFKAYSGATVSTTVTKSCTPSGAECDYYAGIASSTTVTTGGSGGTPGQSVSVDCALPVHTPYPLVCQQASCGCTGAGCEVVVEEGDAADLSANTPTLYSGLNETGNTVTFRGTITNLGNNTISSTFQNRFQVDIGGDGSYDLNLDVPSAAYSIAVNGSTTAVSPPWTNLPAGTHLVRFCADLPPYSNGSVSEANENNNCSGDLTFAVGASPLTQAITASASRVKRDQLVTITWTSQNANSCTVSGPGISDSSRNGAQSVNITGESTYTLTCLRGAQSQTSSVTVKLAPTFQEI